MTRENAFLITALVLIGAGWALTHPLGKIVVAAGYTSLGIIAWQLLIGAVLTYCVLLFRGRRLPFTRQAFAFWLLIALIGTLIPNFTSFSAMQHLPAGIMSIVIATIPMLSFPIALVLGIDDFSTRRLLGLCLGLAGVSFIAWPEVSLPDQEMVILLPLALVAPLFYVFEGNIVAQWGMGGPWAAAAVVWCVNRGGLYCRPVGGAKRSAHRPAKSVSAGRSGAAGIVGDPCDSLYLLRLARRAGGCCFCRASQRSCDRLWRALGDAVAWRTVHGLGLGYACADELWYDVATTTSDSAPCH
jgi:drug/metabolite transporter (DMT)-like permease